MDEILKPTPYSFQALQAPMVKNRVELSVELLVNGDDGAAEALGNFTTRVFARPGSQRSKPLSKRLSGCGVLLWNVAVAGTWNRDLPRRNHRFSGEGTQRVLCPAVHLHILQKKDKFTT
jgi:hypothetical protein